MLSPWSLQRPRITLLADAAWAAILPLSAARCGLDIILHKRGRSIRPQVPRNHASPVLQRQVMIVRAASTQAGHRDCENPCSEG
jgi:hypothetical protein